MRRVRGVIHRARWALGSAAAAMTIAALSFAWSTPEEASACGRFFPRHDERKPSLSYEQVLIIHDAEANKQHFIREVTFTEGASAFGFVVPTPSRPEVAKVDAAPFQNLRLRFPYWVEPPRQGIGLATAGGIGRGYGSGAGKVEVLEQKKVGSFTAFVLAANDEKALATWLKDNDLVSTPATEAWLAHYVKLEFFYVAMRYDPPHDAAKQGARVSAETIRVSFDTPAPYYPYLEPQAPAPPSGAPRLLELWVATRDPVTPVALLDKGGERSWVRPLRPGQLYPLARATLEGALEDELEKLLPAGQLTVQAFQDQKTSRAGFGDILFVPKEKRELDAKRKDALRPLVGLLDPTLVAERSQP